VKEVVLRWGRAAGLTKRVTPHTLRRSCATGMIRNRANPAHVKELLGHEDFSSLDAYIRLEIVDLKDAHRKFHPREQHDDDGTGASRGDLQWHDLAWNNNEIVVYYPSSGRGMYQIVFYTNARGEPPVEEFVNAMPTKQQRKVGSFLELLAQEGPALRRPYADHVRGDLRELRLQFGRNEYRIFHFFVRGQRVVLVHAFAKKTQQLPDREIETALERMKDFLSRFPPGR
jgi:phage-related protein